MALWGNRDSKSASGTVSITSGGAVTGSSTAFTTQARIGDTIKVGTDEYVIVNIASNTACTVKPGINGGTMAVKSGQSYTLSEKPEFVALSESAGSPSGVHGDITKVFGVSTALGENYASAGLVVEVAVANGGSRYAEVPGVTFTGGGGSGAAATAIISGGVVTGITLTNNGSSYENVPTVTIQVPVLTVATTAINTTSNTISYTNHGLALGDQVTYNNGGGTSATGLTSGNTYYVISSGLTANAFKVSETEGGSEVDISGTGNNAQYFIIVGATRATAVAALGGGNEAGESQSNIAHAGWIRRTVGTGGRAGRVHYETLVAMGSITGDQADDRQFPDD